VRPRSSSASSGLGAGSRLVLALCLLAGLAGCGGSGAGQETLTVYVSAPLHGEHAAAGRAIVSGARRALAEAAGRAADFEIRAVYLDDTGGGRRWTPVATAANARRAAEDSSAIAYIGELDSAATRFSLPITNQADIAQVAPGSGAVDLTRASGRGPGPDRYRPSGDQTFARLIAADDVQARAAAVLARRLDAARALAVGDRSLYSNVVGDAFSDEAVELGIDLEQFTPRAGAPPIPAPGFDLAFYSGTSAERLVDLALHLPAARLIATDAVDPRALRRRCDELPGPVYLTSAFREDRPGFAGADPVEAYGYEAMALVLDAIGRAGGDGDNRGAVVDAVTATSARRSAIGRYSIEPTGDTTLDRTNVQLLRGCRLERFAELAPAS
jgi:branched-chain amino acid transport system substrate-binding protein